MSEFTKDILQARKAKGMTQEQLASAMGVSRQLVSHWENGRAEPTAQQREKLNEVLSMGEKKPPRKRKNLFVLAAVIALILAIAVLMIVRVIKSGAQTGIPAQAATQPAQADNPQLEKYTWEWFQEEDVPEEGKAFLSLVTAEKPLKLIQSGDPEKPYIWDIILFAQETNGVPFTMKRATEFLFNNEKLQMDSTTYTGDELEWYWYTTRFEGDMLTSYATRHPADGSIGYGIAVEGEDDNGNSLTFKLYIPLSSEIRERMTPEDFTKETEPQEGQAYLTVEPIEEPTYLTRDAFFEGGEGWYYGFKLQNESDVAFTPESFMDTFFSNGEQMNQVIMPAFVFDAGEMKKGDEPFLYEDAAASQDFDQVGIVVKGKDANGNELSFKSILNLKREYAQP